MSDAVLVALIAGAASTLAALAALLVGIINGRNIMRIEIATNSMKDALVAATDKEARARGHAEGVREEQERKKP